VIRVAELTPPKTHRLARGARSSRVSKHQCYPFNSLGIDRIGIFKTHFFLEVDTKPSEIGAAHFRGL
jgi:hypothetical protein